MANTSATGGYLQPAVDSPPLEGQSFEDFLQEVFVGITALPAENVVPRWQPEPPNTPPLGVDWMAFGIQEWNADTYAYVEHDPATNGTDSEQRHEVVDILVSSYGPNAALQMAKLRDGFLIAQNREVLQLNGIGFQEASKMVNAPELIKEGKYRVRIDMHIFMKRVMQRTYPVLNLLSGSGLLIAENAAQIVIEEPLTVTQ